MALNAMSFPERPPNSSAGILAATEKSVAGDPDPLATIHVEKGRNGRGRTPDLHREHVVPRSRPRHGDDRTANELVCSTIAVLRRSPELLRQDSSMHGAHA